MAIKGDGMQKTPSALLWPEKVACGDMASAVLRLMLFVLSVVPLFALVVELFGGVAFGRHLEGIGVVTCI